MNISTPYDIETQGQGKTYKNILLDHDWCRKRQNPLPAPKMTTRWVR
jgi:hypothetical protein